MPDRARLHALPLWLAALLLWTTASVACSSDEPGGDEPPGDTGDTATVGDTDPHTDDDTPPAEDATEEVDVDPGDTDDDTEVVEIPEDIVFPEGFLFGTAIAGFQVDMGCPTLPADQCNDTASDWYLYTTAPETVTSEATHMSGQDVAAVGPGFWELYPEDIARARDELHNNALRVSIEWSRIFPEATDGIEGHEALSAVANAEAVAHYHAIFQAMRQAGLEPIVTLNHYTLPLWIHDPVGCHLDLESCSPRGWVDRERTVTEIARYAGFCAVEFGAEVDTWATLNEPLQNMLFGYVQPNAERTHPPAAVFALDEARIVLDALIEGHAAMYDAIKAGDTVDADGDGQGSFIGVVYPMAPMSPRNPNRDLDVQGADNLDYLWNKAFLRATALGLYDEHLDGNAVLRDDLEGRMDYVGINWYFGLTVTGTFSSFVPEFSPLLTVDPFSLLEFGDNQPERLPEMIAWVNDELGLPVIITENGDPVVGDDGDASGFLVRNLAATGQALADGADVRGYMYWSLMDNFEWNHGMAMDFGLYAVAPDDPARTRTARPAATTYGAIARTRVLPGALIAEHRLQP